MGYVATKFAPTHQFSDLSALSSPSARAIDIEYANELTSTLKSLGWSNGRDGGPIRGIHAYGYSREEQQAIDFYVREAKKLGMTSLTDLAGNVYLVREGRSETRDSLQSVLVTSHLDTVEGGGAYDGRDGLVAALAAVKALKDSDTTLPHDLVIMVCRSEESDINGVFSLGARLASGDISWGELEKCTNRKSGQPVIAHMRELGLDVDALKKKLSLPNPDDRALIPVDERAKSAVKALIELHIEQGKYVSGDPSNPDVGLVQRIRGNARAKDCTITPNIAVQENLQTATLPRSRGRSYTIKVPIKGEAAHSGATHQRDRADAVSTALVIGASMLSRFGGDGSKQGPALQIVDLSTTNTSPTTIAGDATITFRVANASSSEITKIVSNLKKLCRKLSGDSRNKQLRIGHEGTISSLDPTPESNQENPQIHAVLASYVAFMKRVRHWFTTCCQNEGRDIVFTPAVVNLNSVSAGSPALGFNFEIRSVDSSVLTRFSNFITGLVPTLNESLASFATINVPQVRVSDPVQSDQDVLQELSKVADRIGVRFNLVNSGAGHDTSTLTRRGYSGAIVFIKQPNPVSHNPDETRDDTSFVRASQLLTEFLIGETAHCDGDSFVAQLRRQGALSTGTRGK